MRDKILYTGIGALIGLGVAIYPTTKYIMDNTGGSGSGTNNAITVSLFFGPILGCGVIGYSLAQYQKN